MGNRSDNFTRANSSTALGTPSDGGSAWQALSGTWGISSDLGENVSGGSQEAAVLDAGISDCLIEWDFAAVTTSGGNGGFVFRATDNSNYWLVTLGASGAVLFEQQGGGFTSRATNTTFAAANGDKYWAKLAGTSISVYRNSLTAAPILTYTVTDGFNLTATKHGLRANGDTSQRWSFFGVTGLEFVLTASSAASVGNATTLTVTPNLPAAANTTVTITDDLSNTIGTLNFTTGATAAQALNWTPAAAQVGARTLTATASPVPGGGATTTAAVTVYNLTLLPATQNVTGGAAASLTATLSGGTGTINATASIGALSTATPASGTPFTETPPNATGTATVTATGPGGTTATATVTYSVDAAHVSLATAQGFPAQFAGLRGTVGFTVKGPDGSVYQARSTANVADLGGGNYLGQFAGVPGASYCAVWDTGGSSPLSGTPDLVAAVNLASTGLDAISTADPGGIANQTTLAKMLVAVWRAIKKKSTLTATQQKFYADDGVTVNETQAVGDDGVTQTRGAAS